MYVEALALVALSIGSLALLAAAYALAGYVRWRDVPRQRVEQLDAALGDFDYRLANLYESHKRLRSRVGMRELRERKGGPDYVPTTETADLELTPNLSYADYKRRLREKAGLKPGQKAPHLKSVRNEDPSA